MSQGTVLVTGATGDTGRATVEQLLARGRHVRALAHREDARSKRLHELGAEVVFGDFLDLDAIRAAVQGVQRAYFCYPIRPGIIQATAYFAQAAKEAGIDGVVNMSQICSRADAKSHAMGDHWLAERVFDWSGLNVAHLRPTLFAESLLVLAPMIRAGLLHVPFGTGRHAPIAAEDQARVIVGILEGPTGESFLTQHLREVAIDHQNGVFAGTNDVVKKIGGRQPTTLEEFITKHRQAFA